MSLLTGYIQYMFCNVTSYKYYKCIVYACYELPEEEKDNLPNFAPLKILQTCTDIIDNYIMTTAAAGTTF